MSVNKAALTEAWPDPDELMLRSPIFEAIWQRIKNWDIAVPTAYEGYCGATGNHVRAILDAFPPGIPAPQEYSTHAALGWAFARWHAEVSKRPLQNVHRRSLDDTWRQVIRYLGGDDVALCGPTHDDLISSAPPPPPSERNEKEGER